MEQSNEVTSLHAERDGRLSRSVANAPRGIEYWERLARWINEEPVEERDRVMMAMLRSIGIEKSKPFHPDDRLRKILTEAVLVGEAMAKAADSGGSRPRIRDDVAHHSDLISPGVPR